MLFRSLHILASRREPFGAVVAEAASMGKPSVVSNIGGPSEIVVDGVTGLHVNPLDPSSISDAVNTLLADKGLRLEMGRLARARAVNMFDVNIETAQYEHLYKQLMEGFV